MTSLQLLFEAIHQVKEEDDLQAQLAPGIGKYFAAKKSGIFFFDQLPLVNRPDFSRQVLKPLSTGSYNGECPIR